MTITEDATITSKGQVTIPKRIRDELDLDAGTEVEFRLEADGTIRIRRKRPPMERLRAARETLAPLGIDVDALRRESERAWSSLDDSDGDSEGGA